MRDAAVCVASKIVRRLKTRRSKTPSAHAARDFITPNVRNVLFIVHE